MAEELNAFRRSGQINQRQMDFMQQHGMYAGGPNEKWITKNPCMFWANLVAHDDAGYILSELQKDTVTARKNGVPEDLIRDFLNEALEERQLLVQHAGLTALPTLKEEAMKILQEQS